MPEATPLPERPADVDPHATTAELLDRYHRHLVPLAGARSDGGRTPAHQLVRHALAALATAEAIVERLHAERWPLVVDALRHGAPISRVGAAMAGLDVQEVRVGLLSWADRLRGERLLTAADHAFIAALVAPGRAR